MKAMKARELWPPLDPLGEALHFLRMSGAFHVRSELTAPRGLTLPPIQECLSFHVVTSGRCWLEVDSLEPVELARGDLALVPHGRGHRMTSETGAPAPRVDQLPHQMVSDRHGVLRVGGGGAPAGLICVARWRMHVALTWLKEQGAALGQVASRLGYQSEASFRRAFKRMVGVSPDAARLRGTAELASS
jgi:hypothetical protein